MIRKVTTLTHLLKLENECIITIAINLFDVKSQSIKWQTYKIGNDTMENATLVAKALLVCA